MTNTPNNIVDDSLANYTDDFHKYKSTDYMIYQYET